MLAILVPPAGAAPTDPVVRIATERIASGRAFDVSLRYEDPHAVTAVRRTDAPTHRAS